MDEMLLRASTEEQMGFSAAMGAEVLGTAHIGRVLLVEDLDAPAFRMIEALKADNDVVHLTDTARAPLGARDGNYDIRIVSLNLENIDGLRLCSQLRSLDRTRHRPILIVVEPGEEERLHRGPDMGVSDYIVRPVSTSELRARVRTQMKRKHCT